jgi:hypothetical protein
VLADHLTKEQLDRHFPTPATELGPVYTWRARIYGRDVTYPMQANVTVAAFAVLKAVVERLEGGVVKWWTQPPFSHPVPVHEERVNIGELFFSSQIKTFSGGEERTCEIVLLAVRKSAS